MFGFHVRRNSTDSPNTLIGAAPTKWRGSSSSSSPRTEIGEIDTSSPFQSVKAAVSLFGDAVTSPRNVTPSANRPLGIRRPRTPDDQRVVEKETQLQLALKGLEDFKERLKNTLATNAQARHELEKANTTLQEVTNKLEIISESKQNAIEFAKAAKQRVQEIQEQNSSQSQREGEGGQGVDAWKQDVDNDRDPILASSAELISAKHELTMLRQDFDGVLEVKLASIQQAADAQQVIQVNQERISQISKEIASLRGTIEHVKLATREAQDSRNQHNVERVARLQSHARAKGELDLKINSLKEGNDLLLLLQTPPKIMEEKLVEATEAVKVLQEQLNIVKDSNVSSLKNITEELNDARRELEQILEEENRQGSLVNKLRLEVEELRKKNSNLKNTATGAENRVQTLKAELETYRNQLVKVREENMDPDKVSPLCYDLNSQIQQLALESKKAIQESEETNKNMETLRQDAKTACIVSREAEERLKIKLDDQVEEAKGGERHAGDTLRKIKLSIEEFECLRKKAEECRAEAEMKVESMMGEREWIKGREREALKKMETIKGEKDRVERGIEEAVKQAQLAEAAKRVVEAELLKWRRTHSFNS